MAICSTALPLDQPMQCAIARFVIRAGGPVKVARGWCFEKLFQGQIQVSVPRSKNHEHIYVERLAGDDLYALIANNTP